MMQEIMLILIISISVVVALAAILLSVNGKKRGSDFWGFGLICGVLALTMAAGFMVISLNTGKADLMSDSKEDDLLKMAEIRYDALNYEGALDILTSHELSDNTVALQNVAYMYAKGLFVVKDTKKAEMYYMKAIDLGAEGSKKALFAMYAENDLDTAVEYLKENAKSSTFKSLVSDLFDGAALPVDDDTAIWMTIYDRLFSTQENNVESSMPLASTVYDQYNLISTRTTLVEDYKSKSYYVYKHTFKVLTNPGEFNYVFVGPGK